MTGILGRLFGVSLQNELLIMTLLGLANSTLHWKPFELMFRLNSIKDLAISVNGVELSDGFTNSMKKLLGFIVIVNFSCGMINPVTYLLKLYPVITWRGSGLLVPWLVTHAINTVLPKLMSITVAFVFYSARVISTASLTEFLIVESINILIAWYNWYVFLMFYIDLRDIENSRLRIAHGALPRRSKSHSSNPDLRNYLQEFINSDSVLQKLKRAKSLESLTTEIANRVNEIDDNSTTSDSVYLTPAEKSMIILKLTKQEVEEARKQKSESRMCSNSINDSTLTNRSLESDSESSSVSQQNKFLVVPPNSVDQMAEKKSCDCSAPSSDSERDSDDLVLSVSKKITRQSDDPEELASKPIISIETNIQANFFQVNNCTSSRNRMLENILPAVIVADLSTHYAFNNDGTQDLQTLMKENAGFLEKLYANMNYNDRPLQKCRGRNSLLNDQPSTSKMNDDEKHLEDFKNDSDEESPTRPRMSLPEGDRQDQLGFNNRTNHKTSRSHSSVANFPESMNQSKNGQKQQAMTLKSHDVLNNELSKAETSQKRKKSMITNYTNNGFSLNKPKISPFENLPECQEEFLPSSSESFEIDTDSSTMLFFVDDRSDHNCDVNWLKWNQGKAPTNNQSQQADFLAGSSTDEDEFDRPRKSEFRNTVEQIDFSLEPQTSNSNKSGPVFPSSNNSHVPETRVLTDSDTLYMLQSAFSFCDDSKRGFQMGPEANEPYPIFQSVSLTIDEVFKASDWRNLAEIRPQQNSEPDFSDDGFYLFGNDEPLLMGGGDTRNFSQATAEVRTEHTDEFIRRKNASVDLLKELQDLIDSSKQTLDVITGSSSQQLATNIADYKASLDELKKKSDKIYREMKNLEDDFGDAGPSKLNQLQRSNEKNNKQNLLSKYISLIDKDDSEDSDELDRAFNFKPSDKTLKDAQKHKKTSKFDELEMKKFMREPKIVMMTNHISHDGARNFDSCCSHQSPVPDAAPVSRVEKVRPTPTLPTFRARMTRSQENLEEHRQYLESSESIDRTIQNWNKDSEESLNTVQEDYGYGRKKLPASVSNSDMEDFPAI
ncbi:hypothetical protein TKK_0011453 [Trichogramma kaykai]